MIVCISFSLQRTIIAHDDVGVARGTAFQEIRPGAGFKTGDFVIEKLGGTIVERLLSTSFEDYDGSTAWPRFHYELMFDVVISILYFVLGLLYGYQALSPTSYRLVITIILQGHPGSWRAL